MGMAGFHNNNNNMNLNNNINGIYDNREKLCPYNPIINKININNYNDTTFINSVLISFASLKYISIWMHNLDNQRQQILLNNQNSLTKELYILYYNLYKGFDVDSSNFILNYNNKYSTIYKGMKLYEDPYHFLFYLIDLIHLENNFPPNPNFNLNILETQTIDNLRNDDYMFNLFGSFFQQTQNSIISNYFYNIIKNQLVCNLCSKLYFYAYKFILKFDIDNYKLYRNQAYPQRATLNLSMNDCFDCYTGGYSKKCQKCKSQGAFQYSSIISNSKILIIALYRNNHVFKCDLDFPNRLNLYEYCNNKNISQNYSYKLRACISMDNQNQYFADILINNYWFRYFKNNKIMLGNVQLEMHTHEPQLLFYELEERQMHNNGYIIPTYFVNNINNMIVNNRFNNINFMPMNIWQQNIAKQNLLRQYQLIGQMNMMMQNMRINNLMNQNKFFC